jgi:hypothetical protein
MDNTDNPTVGACDVCVLVDNDHRLKPGVFYCNKCQAWLCESCRHAPFRRFLAMWKRKVYRARGALS